MIIWEVQGCLHITFLPRKPTPLGIQLKTLVDAISGILLGVEIVEGKAVDSQKKWYAEYGHCAATTLRMCEPYAGQERTLIGDAWFGSFKTAYHLAKMGVHCVLNLKNHTAHAAKRDLVAMCPERGD